MKPMKRIHLKDNRGSALISVFMLITVIIILGMGILALSLANTKQAKTTDTYEKDFYVADGAAKQAVEAVNNAALEQYRLIAIDVKNNGEGTTSNNATDFFNGMAALLSAYVPVQPDSSAGGPTSVTVPISNNGGSPTRVYTVLATATDSKTTRKISSTVSITFKKVTLSSAAFTPLGDQVLLCGGMFDVSKVHVDITGTAEFGALKINPWNFNYNGNNNPDQATLNTLIDPSLSNNLNWNMKYPGYTEEPKTTPVNPIYLSNGSNYSSNNPVSPVYLEGNTGASFTVSSTNSGFTSGQIWCDKKLTLSSDTLSGSPSNYIKIYSSGDMTITSTPMSYCKIYCDGNLSISGGSGISNLIICCHGNITIGSVTRNNLKIFCDKDLTITGGSSTNDTIYCKGTFNDGSTDRYNTHVYCNVYKMSGGNFYSNPSGDSIVYAETSMHIESICNGLFYTNGNLDCGGGRVTGQVAAKGSITTNGYSFIQNSAMMARINVNPFTSSSPADSNVQVVQPKNTDIFTNTPTYVEQ
jgi:hypothetical protein